MMQLWADWAESLSSCAEIPQDKVAALVELCGSGKALHGSDSDSIRDVLTRLIPLVKFLEHAQGQHVGLVLPAICNQLPAIQRGWTRADGNSADLEAQFATLFASIRNILRAPHLAPAAQQSLSKAVVELLREALQPAVLRQAPIASGLPLQRMLRALTRSIAFTSNNHMPVLPVDALTILAELVEPVVLSDDMLQGWAGHATAKGVIATANGTKANGFGERSAGVVRSSGTGPQERLVYDDDKPILLILGLVQTVLDGLPRHIGATEAAVLMGIVNWSCVTVRSALSQLLEAVLGWAAVASGEAVKSQGTGASTRAAARLGAIATTGLLIAASTSQAASVQLQQQVEDVIDVLLDIAETCTAAAAELPSADIHRDQVLDIAAYVLEDCSALMSTGACLNALLGGALQRLKAVLLATAALVPNAAHVSQLPATTSAAAPMPYAGHAQHAQHVGHVHGHGQRGATANGHAIGQAAAAAAVAAPAASKVLRALTRATASDGGNRGVWEWDIHRPLTESYVHLQEHGWGAQHLTCTVAEALCQGLRVTWQAGQQSFVQALLLMPEGLASSFAEQQAMTLIMGRLFILLRCDHDLAKMVLAVLTDALASGRNVLAPQVYACMAKTLAAPLTVLASLCAAAAMAAATIAARNGSDWAYDQVLDLLLRMYRNPFKGAGQLLMSAGGMQTGANSALAEALTSLAQGTRQAPAPVCRDMLHKLLTLASDLGMRIGVAPSVIKDLGELLPAIAAATAEGHGAMRSSRSLARNGSRYSYTDIEQAYKAEGSFIKLLRNLWLYISLFKLATTEAPTHWRAAAGRIAAVTPMLLVGVGLGRQEDVLERLKAEFADRLAHAGSAGDVGFLRDSLMASIDQPTRAAFQLPDEAVKLAYYHTILTCETCRAALAPLPQPGAASPLSVILGHLQVVDSGSKDAKWFQLVAEQVFRRYISNVELQRLRETAAARVARAVPDKASMTGPHVEDGGWVLVQHVEQLAPHPEACIEDLAITLIQHLASSSGAQEDSCSVLVSELASGFLQHLLGSYPGLFWKHSCIRALLGMLDAQERELPIGELPAISVAATGGRNTVWAWLQSWIRTAAYRAPLRTEALLHQFLGLTSVRSPANLAALRRSSELLAICSDARQAVSWHASGPQDGVLALSRKQYYAGLVEGMLTGGQYDQAGPSSSSTVAALAAKLGQALDQAVNNHLAMPVLEQQYLTAAALLASSNSSSWGESAACYSLLKSLCMAPLKRFTPDMMALAVFAWTWVSSAAAGWLVPLASQVASCWHASIDQGLGLFSGEWGREVTSDTEYNPDRCTLSEVEVLQGLHCHHHWLYFFTELWSTVGDKSDEEQAALSQVYSHLLHQSLHNPSKLSLHPAACAARFRLLQLGLRYVQQCVALLPKGSKSVPALLALLHDKVLRAALYWFMYLPKYSAHLSKRQAQEQVTAVSELSRLLSREASTWPGLTLPRVYHGTVAAAPAPAHPALGALHHQQATAGHAAEQGDAAHHPVWGHTFTDGAAVDHQVIELLQFLLRVEVDRLSVWAAPREAASAAASSILPSPAQWDQFIKTAWQVQPQLAVALVQRFPTTREAQVVLERLLAANATNPAVQSLPEAALMLATPKAAAANAPHLAALSTWAPASAVQGLELLSGPSGRNPAVKQYAIRCLHNTPPEEVAFFLAQLVQTLRSDSDGSIQAALLRMAQNSNLFAHQLIWALATEEEPPPEAFNPEVKRSGWQPPKDNGLWQVAKALKQRVLASLTPNNLAYWEAENSYFEQITNVSGILKKVPKDERKAKLIEVLQTIHIDSETLYLPTNPNAQVITHIPSSGAPMQSAAKTPILVAFQVEEQGSVTQLQQGALEAGQGQAAVSPGRQHTMACIFKVGDDVRQDVLALQVIQLLQQAFKKAGLALYLCPYGCVPTGYERGIIEVVPNTKSRAALGELSDSGLLDIFQAEFGAPGTPAFEAARRNFMSSEAGYAIASYLLQAKDRHNGNLLIDNQGHLIHIDFGFILEISPGGNLGFESAAFKLSHEMAQLLDPGGNQTSPHFALFEEMCIRGYLAARTVAEPIIATVALMADSGLPCFGRGAPVENLRKRFHLEMSERQAAQEMHHLVRKAYQRWTTGLYDYIQNVQNKIPY